MSPRPLHAVCLPLVLSIALCDVAQAAPPPPAVELPSLANLLPAETFAFATVDVRALVEGSADLDVAKLLRDPEMLDFLAPLLETLELSRPDDPVASLLEAAALRDWIGGTVAVGLVGVTFEATDAHGKPVTRRVSPSHPLTARTLHDVIELNVTGQSTAAPLRVSLDFLAAFEPGPRVTELADTLLTSRDGYTVRTEMIAGRNVDVIEGPLGNSRMNLFLDRTGPRWLYGGDRASFEVALRGGPAETLAQSETFRRFHARAAAGRNVAFAHVDAARLLAMVRGFVPPVGWEWIEMFGLDSVQGLAFGASITEGGVRESLLFGLDGSPTGFFAGLNALGGEMPLLEQAPADLAAFVGMKFDAQRLLDELMRMAETLFPRNYQDCVAAIAQAKVGALSLTKDVLPALGSSLAVQVEPPRGTPIPDAVLSLEVRDRAAFERVLAEAKAGLERDGVTIGEVRIEDADGAPGFTVQAEGAPVVPAFALRDGVLHGAISPLVLREHVLAAKPATGQVAGQGDGAVARILKGLAGDERDAFALLLLVNLRSAVPPLLATFEPFLQQQFDAAETGLQTAQLPLPETIADHLSGAAVALTVDPDGVSVDLFSPTGLVPFAVFAGIVDARRDAQGGPYVEERFDEQEREY